MNQLTRAYISYLDFAGRCLGWVNPFLEHLGRKLSGLPFPVMLLLMPFYILLQIILSIPATLMLLPFIAAALLFIYGVAALSVAIAGSGLGALAVFFGIFWLIGDSSQSSDVL